MSNLKTKDLGFGLKSLYTIWGIACFVFFRFWYHYHFFYQEQNQLFLWSKDYLLTYLDKPGWFACLLGDFFTQFYYYPSAGPAILTFAILLLGRNIRRAFQNAGMKSLWLPVLLSFIAMIVCAALSLHYEYRLCSIIALTGGASVFRVSTNNLTKTRMFIKKIEHMQKGNHVVESTTLPHLISAISIIITVPVCHWFFGSGVVVYAALVITACLIYIMQPYTYLRLGSLIFMMMILMLGKRLYYINFEKIYTYPSFGMFVKPEFDLEKTFAVDFEYYRGNYNKVMNIVEKEKDPNRYMTFYYNLVVAQNKGLSDNLLKFPDNCLGTQESINFDTSNLTSKSLGELYWILGDMTFAERAAILSNINSPQSRNIRQIKRLAEINFVTGETEAAKKFLRILQKTFVWSHWADRMLEGLGKNANAESRATIMPYLDKQKYVNTRDTLRNNDNCYVMMKELVESNPANNMAINYMLCTDLLQKDLKNFMDDYDAYYLKQERVLYDPMYQQALMIYLYQTNAPASEWSKYIKRNDIKKRFYQYVEQRGSTAFSDTYWYFYDKGEKYKSNKQKSTK